MRRIFFFLLLFVTSVNVYGNETSPQCTISSSGGGIIDIGIIASMDSPLSAVEMKLFVSCKEDVPLVFTLTDRQGDSASGRSNQTHFGLGLFNGKSVGYAVFTPVNQAMRVDGVSSFALCSLGASSREQFVDYLLKDEAFFLCSSLKNAKGMGYVPVKGKNFELTLLIHPYLHSDFKESGISEQVNLNASVLFNFRAGL